MRKLKYNSPLSLIKFLTTTALTFVFILFVGCTGKGGSEENVYNVPVAENVKGLDPAHSSDAYANLVNSHIYETLYDYHYLKRPLEVITGMAATMPEYSKDGKTVTIKIKPGLKYQDDACFKATSGKGREITAEDFIYAWKRLADPTKASDGWWIFDGKIKGLNEWRDKVSKKQADFTTPVEGLAATDKNTLVIKLNEPYFQLVYVLTMVYSSPLPKECVDHYGDEFLNHPIGSGAFKLESWVRNSKITLVKNNNWAGEAYPSEGEPGDKEKGLLEDAGKPLPFVEKVVFHEIIEDQPRWLNFMKGQLDLSDIPKDSFDNAVKDGKLAEEFSKKGLQLMITDEPDVTYTAFNMEDPVVGKNKYLRQALSMVSDYDTLIQRYYNGRAVKAESMIPPTVDGFDPNYKNPYRLHDIEKAKELLKKAGYPDGKGLPELVYDTTSGATSRQFAEFIQQEWSKIGVKVSIKMSTWPEFQKRIKEKRAQVWGIAWGADYPDAQNFMQLFYGPNKSPGSNASNYVNKEFDRLYEQSMKLPPGPERTKIYAQMRDLVVEDSPWIFNVHRRAFRIYHGWVKNYKRHSILGGIGKYVRIDAKQRAEQKKKL